MTTLADVRNEIKADLQLGSDYDAQIDSKIRAALRLLRGNRLWFLKATTTALSTGSGVTSTSLASIADFSVAGTIELSYSGTWRGDGTGFDHLSFERLKLDWWNNDPIPSGIPEACAILGNTLYYSHTTAASYSLRVTYYKQDATLPTSDASTSVWFDEGFDAVRGIAQTLVLRDVLKVGADQDNGDIAKGFLESLYTQHQNYDSGRA